MKIHVPQRAQAEFWDEPPTDAVEFWGFRWRVKCQPGDPIEFYFGKTLVAIAVVDRVEPPGRSKCDHSGRFGTLWKVFWRPETFRDLRS